MHSTTHFVERWTGWTLRLGVWVSGAVMVAGLLLAALQSPQLPPTSPSMTEVLSRVFSSSIDALTIMSTGIILLMLTPFLRVITAFAGFLAEKDWKFSLVSLIVFLMLVGELVYSLR